MPPIPLPPSPKPKDKRHRCRPKGSRPVAVLPTIPEGDASSSHPPQEAKQVRWAANLCIVREYPLDLAPGTLLKRVPPRDQTAYRIYVGRERAAAERRMATYPVLPVQEEDRGEWNERVPQGARQGTWSARTFEEILQGSEQGQREVGGWEGEKDMLSGGRQHRGGGSGGGGWGRRLLNRLVLPLSCFPFQRGGDAEKRRRRVLTKKPRRSGETDTMSATPGEGLTGTSAPFPALAATPGISPSDDRYLCEKEKRIDQRRGAGPASNSTIPGSSYARPIALSDSNSSESESEYEFVDLPRVSTKNSREPPRQGDFEPEPEYGQTVHLDHRARPLPSLHTAKPLHLHLPIGLNPRNIFNPYSLTDNDTHLAALTHSRNLLNQQPRSDDPQHLSPAAAHTTNYNPPPPTTTHHHAPSGVPPCPSHHPIPRVLNHPRTHNFGAVVAPCAGPSLAAWGNSSPGTPSPSLASLSSALWRIRLFGRVRALLGVRIV
ncbi:hypothetical protein SAPIO_CDS6679 [Scedosporium apiospermum]|uniref:Uncharacterized protein n=1 Tax=Pseudallescheria apiosperma TaxID=563466 RepID=A0A084G3F7_PSEDA|nr:uncharacterized protein SAPIO_CDS6679 [Scedosporium apiospermum]KEZ41869.1 hypothetical protein SAPIO_CDS6679 [Scedosporium apiospermum]